MAVPILAPVTLAPRTALDALAGPPRRFLASAWPWRSLAYLLAGVVPGLAFAAVLAPVRTVEGPLAVPLSFGVAAVLLVPVARFERWRLRLADRQPVRGLPGGWWPGWREAGHALVALVFSDEGLRAVLELREARPSLAVLVLSQYVEQTYAAELLDQTRSPGGAASATC